MFLFVVSLTAFSHRFSAVEVMNKRQHSVFRHPSRERLVFVSTRLLLLSLHAVVGQVSQASALFGSV